MESTATTDGIRWVAVPQPGVTDRGRLVGPSGDAWADNQFETVDLGDLLDLVPWEAAQMLVAELSRIVRVGGNVTARLTAASDEHAIRPRRLFVPLFALRQCERGPDGAWQIRAERLV